MTSLLRRFTFALIGMTFAIFGVCHSIRSYPDPKAFATVSRELPMIGAIVSFGFGVAIAVIGLLILLPVALRLRQRAQSRNLPQYTGASTSRPGPDRHDDDFDLDPDADPYGFGPEEDAYDPDRRRGGYHSYPETAGRNGRLDHRQLVGGRP